MIRPKAILDSCVLVDIMRGKRPDLETRTKELDLSNCAIADLTIFELLCGAEKSEHSKENREIVLDLTRCFQSRPVQAGYEYAAKEKVRLQKKGIIIEDIDLLIGCLCAAEGFPLVTSNKKHMDRIQGLKIIPW